MRWLALRCCHRVLHWGCDLDSLSARVSLEDGNVPGFKEKEMTPLRQRMLDALELRGMAARTREAYIDAVARLARSAHA